MDDSKHFDEMLNERGIRREWADRTTSDPDHTADHEDGTRHYIKRIPEFGNRHLRVIVNVSIGQEKRVTAFFDRRLRKNQ